MVEASELALLGLVALAGLVGLTVLRGPLAQRASGAMERLTTQIAEHEKELDGVAAAGRYLTTPARQGLAEGLARPERELAAWKPITWMARRPRRVHRELQERIKQLRLRLEKYNGKHVAAEIKAHHDMLIEELRLDPDQCLAVVRDDARNLVIAAAGAGKTTVLTTRIRYLASRRDHVEPSRILAVTFTRAAAQEMRNRLLGKGLDHVRISTLHALGLDIVRAARNDAVAVAAEHELESLIRRAIADAERGDDPGFASLYRNTLVNFFRDQPGEDGRPLGKPGARRYGTLRGELVKSTGEQLIADFLFLNKVDYRYESRAKWAPGGPDQRAYTPDFYLPKDELYIEHWALDENGRVPPWFRDRDRYIEKVRWARELFHRTGRKLVETYDHERRAGHLGETLEERLKSAGVALRPMTLVEIREEVRAFRRIDEHLAPLLAAFVTNARCLRLGPGDIPPRLRGRTPRVQAFALCGQEVLRRFIQYTLSDGRIDFSDMLHEAADALEKGHVGEPFVYDHILVDEFQDLSAGQARLIKALCAKGGKLFAVGDDWQGIFGFGGGNVSYLVDFKERFGEGTVTPLVTNYRNPPPVVTAGNALIAHNLRKVSKEVCASARGGPVPLVHEVEPDLDAVLDCVAELTATACTEHQPSDVLVLSRVNWPLLRLKPRLQELGVEEGGEHGVRLSSAHGAKGTEAEVVIILDASEDRYGFPSQVASDLLEPVRPFPGEGIEEERRLFYVALTRTKGHLHLVCRRGQRSRFLAEIEGDKGGGPVDMAALEKGARVDLRIRFDRLDEPSEAQQRIGIRQVGSVRFGSSTLGYTALTGSPPVKEGMSRTARGLLVTWYQGRLELQADRQTRLKPLPKSGNCRGVPLNLSYGANRQR